MSMTADINSLPNELLEYILSLTSPYSDLKSALQVCKRWYVVTKEVIRFYRCQFHKAITDGSGVKLVWSYHQPEAGPTVTERYSHSACYCNKSVYIFGGCTSTSTTFNDLWRFDLQHKKWARPLATGTYPSPKACASLVLYKNTLILFGGWSHPTPYTFHQASKFFNQLNIYSPELNRWTQIVTVDSPEGIAGHGGSIINASLVVFGGYHGHGASSNVLWILDLIQMVWTKKLVAEPKPLPRYSHSQICLDNQHILVLGGCGGPNTQFSDAWLLDMSGELWKWRELTVCNPDLASQQLWCHPACLVGDKLVILGKSNAKLSTDVTKPLRPRLTIPRSRPTAPVAAAPIDSNSPQSSSADNFPAQEAATERLVGAVDQSKEPVDNSQSPSLTSGARSGMPAVRPNAMNDRRRRLEALSKHEDLLRAAARQSNARTQSLTVASNRRQLLPANAMCVFVVDISEAIEAGRVTWLALQESELPGAPDEAVFYSLIEGRGELMMFGGIKGDARSLQRGSTSTQQNAVLNDVHFLSFCGSGIH